MTLTALTKKASIFSLAVLAGFFVFNLSNAQAALGTDATTYYTPADPIFTGANGSNGLYTYSDSNSWASPICGGSYAPNTTGHLIPCPSGTSFATTTGNYKLIQNTVLDCAGSSYTTCQSNNPGIPGVNEADFSILTPTSTEATSTAQEQFFGYAAIQLHAIIVLGMAFLTKGTLST